MKLESSFSKFLENTVNLNQTRIDVAKSGIDTITTFLKSNELFGEIFIGTKPQGSFRQRTIIKPPKPDQDFDVDLLFELEPVKEWNPADYLSNLSDQFKAVDRYKEKVDTRGKNRCVTIDYESDFHIDIVPAVKMVNGHVIMNKKTNQFEPTDGDGYALWFEGKNKVTGKNHLISALRLIKYVRDSKASFEAKSILLTTLLGNQVYSSDIVTTQYPDLPTAFLTIIVRLNQYLQANPLMPTVNNPVLPQENFNRHWDQSKYAKFKDKINEYAAIAVDAYAEKDEAKSVEKWRKIFGEKFPESKSNISSAVNVAKRDIGEQFLSDFGIKENIRYNLKIDAQVKQDGFRPFFLRGSFNPLKKKRKLEFFIKETTIPGSFDIKWKVKNTGPEAKDATDLRGEITDDKGFKNKIERTKYTGSHYVECYAIQNGTCVARDRIDVPIANAY